MKKYIAYIVFFLFSISCYGQDATEDGFVTQMNKFFEKNQFEEAEGLFLRHKEELDSVTNNFYYSIINIGKFLQNKVIDREATTQSIMRMVEEFANNKEDLRTTQIQLITYFQIYIGYLCGINDNKYYDVYRIFKDIWPSIINDYSKIYIDILENVSIEEYHNRHYHEAIPIFLEILDLNHQGYQSNTKPHIYMGMIGQSYQNSGNYEDAAKYLDNALLLFTNTEKSNDYDTFINITRDRFEVAKKLSQIVKARELSQVLIPYYESRNDKKQDLINVSISLADMEISAHNMDVAIPLYETGLKYILESKDYDNDSKKGYLSNLYTLYNTCGVKEINRKYQLEKKEFNIQDTTIEVDIVTDQYIDSLLNLVMCQDISQLPNVKHYISDIKVLADHFSSIRQEQFAINLIENSIEKLNNNSSINEQDYALLYSSLGSIYSHLQNLERATEYHKKAQMVYNLNGIINTEYIDILCHLGNDYRESNEYVLAKIYLDEALRLSGTLSSFTSDKSVYYHMLQSLCWLYQSLNNAEKALGYNQLILDDIKQNKKLEVFWNPTLLTRIQCLLNFNHYKEAKEILNTIDSDYINETNSWWTSFDTKFFNNDPTCELDLLKISQNDKESIANLYATVSNNDLNGYWDVTGGNLNFAYSMALDKFNTPSLRKITYDNLLYTKTFQLEVAKLLRSTSLDKLSEVSIKEIEKKISNTEIIRKNLKENDIAIEFFVIHHRPSYKEVQKKYGALILTKELENPIFIELCDIDTLDNIVCTNTLGNAVDFANRYYDINNTEIYNLIWKPLESEVKENANIYISGCSSLLFVNISALSNGKRRLSDIYNIHNVFSTSIIGSPKSNCTYKTAAIYGGIDYNTSLDLMAKESYRYSNHTSNYEYAMYRGIGERGAWGNLQFSEVEADRIETILNEKKIDVRKYVKTNASEESFKALSDKSPDIIHISTHGFYYQPYLQDFRTDYSNSFFSREKKSILDYNGLLFSGANNAWKNNQYKDNVEDGVLTAREISQLNLANTDLVALSACQTGLGELHDVDGNNGLLRAFKIAGVDKIIITLWNVADNATAIFMESFYKNLSLGNGAKSALDETIKQIKKEMPDAYYWAPFMLIE